MGLNYARPQLRSANQVNNRNGEIRCFEQVNNRIVKYFVLDR